MKPEPVFFSQLPFKAVKDIAVNTGAQVYLVGGAVRDIIRNTPSNDLDFVVFNEDYLSFAKKTAKLLKSPFIPFKDNVRIPFRKGYIDISAPRGSNIKEDLAKRDFTINNLAMDMDENIVGNPADIQKGIIRPAYKEAFDDDPLRILRGFRQAATLEYDLSDEFMELAALRVEKLSSVAGERIHDELRKLSSAKLNTTVYKEMQKLGVWKQILGLEPNIDLLSQIMKNCNDEQRFALFLTALLAYNEGRANMLFSALHVSNDAARVITMLLEQSPIAKSLDLLTMKRLIWRNKDDLTRLLYYAKIRYGLSDEHISNYTKLAGSMDAEKASIISGDDLMPLAAKVAPGMRQGRWMSETLESVRISLAFGEINGRDEALRKMTALIENYQRNK